MVEKAILAAHRYGPVITLTIPTADVHGLVNGLWTRIGCMNTVLVMSLTGGMGRVTTTVYKRLTSTISEKRDVQYGKTVNWIRWYVPVLCSLESIHYVNQRGKIIKTSPSL